MSSITLSQTKTMNDNNKELEEFEEFLLQIKEYAKKAGVSVDYIESEFILDGDLIEVPLEK